MTQSLADLLTQDMIQLQASAADWQDALRLGGALLVNSGGVGPEYIDAMIDMVNEMGPYVVIAPGLALGHSRPDAGVRRICFSLLTLQTPVEFGVPSNDPVDVVFSFAAPNKDDHIQALRELAILCSNTENMRRIRAARDTAEIIALLNR